MKIAIEKLRYSSRVFGGYRELPIRQLFKRKLEFEAGTVPPIRLLGTRVLDGMQRVETAKRLGITHIEAEQSVLK